MADAKKIGDARLAQKVVEAFASGLDALTDQECADIGIYTQQLCSALQNALGLGAGGVVTDEEREDLAAAGFSDEFVRGLAGSDGRRALMERVKWLGDHVVTEQWHVNTFVSDLKEMCNELGRIGPAAAPAVPGLIAALRDEDWWVRQEAKKALAAIGPAAVPALASALGEDDPRTRMAAAEYLGNIGKPAHHALPFLDRMIESDPDPKCRQAAGEAVEKILKDVK
jgi:hypothetical protein